MAENCAWRLGTTGSAHRMYPKFAAIPAHRPALAPVPERKTIVCRTPEAVQALCETAVRLFPFLPLDGNSLVSAVQWTGGAGNRERGRVGQSCWAARLSRGSLGSGSSNRSSQTFPLGRITADSSASARRRRKHRSCERRPSRWSQEKLVLRRC